MFIFVLLQYLYLIGMMRMIGMLGMTGMISMIVMIGIGRSLEAMGLFVR